MIRTWLTTLSTSAALALISLASTAVLARALGVEGRGVLAAATLACTLSVGLGNLGLAQAFVYAYRSPQLGLPPNVTERSVALVLGCTGGVALALTFVFPMSGMAMSVLVLGWALTSAGLTFVTTSLQAQPSLQDFNRVRLANATLTIVLLVVVWMAWELLPEIAVGAFLFTTSVCWFWAQRKLSLPRIPHPIGSWGTHFALGLRYYGTGVLGLALIHLDKIYLVYAGTVRQLGLYSAAYGLSRMLNFIQSSLSTAIFARHAGFTEEDTSSSELAARAFRLTFVPMLVLAGTVAVMSPWLIGLVLGSDFKGARLPFCVLVFESVLAGGSWLLAEQFNALGRPGLVLLRQSASLVPLAALVWFVPREHAPLGLSLLLAMSASVRLLVTVVQYKHSLSVSIGRPWATREDLAWLRRVL